MSQTYFCYQNDLNKSLTPPPYLKGWEMKHDCVIYEWPLEVSEGISAQFLMVGKSKYNDHIIDGGGGLETAKNG